MKRKGWLAITGRLINPLIPGYIRDTRPETLFRARVMVALLVFSLGLFVLTWPLPNVGGPARHLAEGPGQWVLFGGTIIIHLAALIIFRNSGSFAVAGNVFVAWMYGALVDMAIMASGPEVDAVLLWMLLVPVYSFLLMGARWGFFWTVIAIGSSAILHEAEIHTLRLDDQHVYWNWLSLTLIVVLCLLIYERVTQRLLGLLERERQRFAHAADHDALTGLRNRAAFDREILRCMAEADAAGQPLALAYVDLDGFKAINDTHGHKAGDQVLRIVGHRLEEVFRDNDVVCRLGGDEFAVILHPVTQAPSLSHRLEKALERLREPILWETGDLYVSASIGAAVYPTDAKTAPELLDKADATMYKAKNGKDQIQLTGDMSE